MLILLNILNAITFIVDAIITFYLVIVFARVVLSWIRLPYNPIVHMIYQATEPVLRPIRRKLPVSWGIDLSPMIVFLVLMAFRMVIIASIQDYVAIARAGYMKGL